MSEVMLLAVSLPLIAAVLIGFAGKLPNVREFVSLSIAVLVMILVLALIPGVLAGHRPTLVLAEVLPGVALQFTLEPLGMIFAFVAALLWPLASVYSIGYMRSNNEKHQTRFYLCFAIAIGSALGVAFAGNLLTLFVFYEVLSLSTYPLVTHKGNDEAKAAGRLYLGILLSTSIGLLLLAILITWNIAGSVEFVEGGVLNGQIGGTGTGILLALFIYGIGKAALMPVHRWLPAAMVAPTPVSALLHAVAVVKAGVFSVVKVVVYVFGLDTLNASFSANWLLVMAGFTVIMASAIALRSDNLKRRLAYSTVSQLSYVILASALFTPYAIMGAALHIIAHAFGKITLFFAAGSIYTAAHKTEVSQLNGIGRRMPWTMTAFAIGSLSMIGVPPMAGFISKWYMLLGAAEAHAWLAIIVIMISTLLNAAYFLPIVYAAFCLPEDDDGHHHEEHGEAPWPVVVPLCVTAGLTVLVFVFPGLPLALAEALAGGLVP